MALSKHDIIRWLEDLPSDTFVGIDDGGLALVVVGDTQEIESTAAYLEVGGFPLKPEALPLRDQLRSARDALFPRDDNALGCGKKKRYIDCTEAERVRNTRARVTGLQLWKYECSECSGWHLSKLQPAQDNR